MFAERGHPPDPLLSQIQAESNFRSTEHEPASISSSQMHPFSEWVLRLSGVEPCISTWVVMDVHLYIYSQRYSSRLQSLVVQIDAFLLPLGCPRGCIYSDVTLHLCFSPVSGSFPESTSSVVITVTKVKGLIVNCKCTQGKRVSAMISSLDLRFRQPSVT